MVSFCCESQFREKPRWRWWQRIFVSLTCDETSLFMTCFLVKSLPNFIKFNLLLKEKLQGQIQYFHLGKYYYRRSLSVAHQSSWLSTQQFRFQGPWSKTRSLWGRDRAHSFHEPLCLATRRKLASARVSWLADKVRKPFKYICGYLITR